MTQIAWLLMPLVACSIIFDTMRPFAFKSHVLPQTYILSRAKLTIRQPF